MNKICIRQIFIGIIAVLAVVNTGHAGNDSSGLIPAGWSGGPIVGRNSITFTCPMSGGKSAGETGTVAIKGDFTGWGTVISMNRAEAEGLYYYTLNDVPKEARIEYAFVVNGIDLVDPCNEKKIDNGLGGTNSIVEMPAYTNKLHCELKGKTAQGTFFEPAFYSAIYKTNRPICIYLPPEYNPNGTEKHAVLYVHDGLEYRTRTDLCKIMDLYMVNKKIKKTIVVFIHNSPDRLNEYARDPNFTRFVTEEIVPFIDKNYRTSQLPEDRVVMGASLGGLMALHLGFTRPDMFGHVGSQSGSFTFSSNNIINEIKAAATQKIKIYCVVGEYDIVYHDLFKWDLDVLKDNRLIEQVLKEKGYTYMYQEYRGGHNWTCWNDQLPQMLVYLLGAK